MAAFEATFSPVGDQAVLVGFGQEIREETGLAVRLFAEELARLKPEGIREWVPSYCGCLVYYDPVRYSFENVQTLLKPLTLPRKTEMLPPAERIRIPVLYGEEAGPDLAFVAEHAGLTAEEVIRRHSSRDYLIYMMGFTPGFPYLGGLDPKLETPRLKTPRVAIPGGSVGIAGKQTGVYPIESPGGWQLIGRTPLKLFDPGRPEPFLLRAGLYLRFDPVTEEEYGRILRLAESGRYEPVRERRESL